MVIAVWLHMFRVFMTGSYKPPREFNWVVGVILLVLTLLLSLHRLPAALGSARDLGGHRRHRTWRRATPLLGHEGPFAELIGAQPRLRRARVPVRRRRDRARIRCCASTSCTASSSRSSPASSWPSTSGGSGATASPARRYEALMHVRDSKFAIGGLALVILLRRRNGAGHGPAGPRAAGDLRLSAALAALPRGAAAARRSRATMAEPR